jgi:hypothetical protein
MELVSPEPLRVFDTTPVKKVFVEGATSLTSYFLYSDNVTLGADPAVSPKSRTSRVEDRKLTTGFQPGMRLAVRGEATLGERGCRCTERFLPFPMTPYEVVEVLQDLTAASSIETNLAGAPAINVSGSSRTTPALRWSIFFRRPTVNGTFLPVLTHVYHGSNMVSSTTAVFPENVTDYHVDEITSQAFASDVVVAVLKWTNIEVELSTKPNRQFSKLGTIPVNVIANDYRFSRPIAYKVGSRPPTSEELRRMVESDAAIMEYQRRTHVTPHRRIAPEGTNRAALIVITVIIAISIFTAIAGNRMRKDSGLSVQ